MIGICDRANKITKALSELYEKVVRYDRLDRITIPKNAKQCLGVDT
jgi:hypothetical protein